MSNFLQTRQKLIHSRNSSQEKPQSQLRVRKDEYEALVQFELKREKQKCKILEQRIHNKQIFIQQMKQYQNQLTASFEKCQEELQRAKKQLEQVQKIQKNQIRHYLEEISDLKHLVIRLEDQINMHQRITHKQYNSAKKKQTSPYNKKQRSKTLMNDEAQEKVTFYKMQSHIQKQISKDITKISHFINCFLSMTQLYCQEASSGKLKTRLRNGWRWIKQVVKEWHYQKQQIKQFILFSQSVKKYLQLPQKMCTQQLLQYIWEKLQDIRDIQ